MLYGGKTFIKQKAKKEPSKILEVHSICAFNCLQGSECINRTGIIAWKLGAHNFSSWKSLSKSHETFFNSKFAALRCYHHHFLPHLLLYFFLTFLLYLVICSVCVCVCVCLFTMVINALVEPHLLAPTQDIECVSMTLNYLHFP